MSGRVRAGVAGAVIAAAACSSATGEVAGGGERFDAATPCFVDPNGPGERDAGTGSTWTALYGDLFGPAGQASCAGEGASCHRAETDPGGRTGFVCGEPERCRETLRTATLPADPAAVDPEETRLLAAVLKRRDAEGCVTGRMPQSPATYVFSEASLERIRTWIRNGAPSD